MRTTIELPDSVYRKGEKVARTQGVTIEEFIIRAFERELKNEPETPSHSKRVTLPLVPRRSRALWIWGRLCSLSAGAAHPLTTTEITRQMITIMARSGIQSFSA
jgi:hypothetical protein